MIQAQQPTALRGGSLRFGLAGQARRMSLAVDRSTGVVEWTEVRRSLRMRLPWAPESSGLPALSRVLLATVAGSVTGSPGAATRIVFLAPDGTALGTSGLFPIATFEALWPRGVFEPLREVGVDVAEEVFRNPRALQRAYPGASRHWYLLDPTAFIGLLLAGGVAVVALFFAILIALISTGVID